MVMLGKVLSHYRIVKLLEEGKTSDLYLAEDTRLDRIVAIRIFRTDQNNDEAKQMSFLQEGKTASSLDHPNIVHVYEIGERDGFYYIAQQHVEGESLENRIVSQAFRINEMIGIAIQLADAVEHAHSKGIAHGNIQTGNVLIDSRRQIKLLHFGEYTQKNPGRTQDKDFAADIHSLGRLFYRLAAGQDPITTAEQSIEPPSRFNYDVPPELDRIILKCLQQGSSSGYLSIIDLLVDLKNLKKDKESGKITAEHSLGPVASKRHLGRWLAPLLLAIAIGIFLWSLRVGKDREVRSLAVLPFVNESMDPEYEYLSDGITDTIINSLSRLPDFKVLSRGTVFSYKGKVADPRQVRRDLKVDAVVMGSIFQRGDTLRIQVSLVRTSDGAQLWGNQFNKKPSDILDVQTLISNEIAGQLRTKLSGEQKQQIQKQYTQNVEAYRLYLKGRFHWNKRTAEDFEKAIESFNEAILIDPKYALAFAGLADTYSVQSNWGFVPSRVGYNKAREAAMEALRIDESLAEAHTSLASVMASYDWDWQGAEKHFKRAIELNPNYSTAHHWYSFYLSQLGRRDEALSEIIKAQSLDPLSMIINANHGYTLYVNRAYDEALRQIQRTLELDPDFALAYQYRGYIYEQKGMLMESISALDQAVHLAPSNLTFQADLARAYATAGNKTEATSRLDALMETARTEYVPAYDIANIYIGLHDYDQAFTWLERAFADHSDVITYLKMEPRMDPIRNDPRFGDLLKRIGL